MFRRLVKIVAFIVFSCSSLAFAADEWKVCLGSFKVRNNADERVRILKRYQLPVSVYEHKTADGTVLYRVLYEEPLYDFNTAYLHRTMLANLPIIKHLRITDVWCVYIEPEPEQVPESRILTIKDSDTGAPIADANVNIDKTWDVTTDTAGKAPIPAAVQNGQHSLVISKDDEYVQTEGTFQLEDDSITDVQQISKAVDHNCIVLVPLSRKQQQE